MGFSNGPSLTTSLFVSDPLREKGKLCNNCIFIIREKGTLCNNYIFYLMIFFSNYVIGAKYLCKFELNASLVKSQ